MAGTASHGKPRQARKRALRGTTLPVETQIAGFGVEAVLW